MPSCKDPGTLRFMLFLAVAIFSMSGFLVYSILDTWARCK